MSIREQLTEQLSLSNSLPFLFVGSGLSRRYIGIDTWLNLLKRFAAKTTVDFDYYLTKSNDDMPQLASLLAIDFHEVWYRSEEYASARADFKGKLKKTDSPLKAAIATHMRSMSQTQVPPEYAHEVDILKNISIDGIITTNWDGFLETLFGSYKVYVGQDSLLFAQPQSVAEIYKIHGCYTDPDSMVLTREDYDTFRRRNAYLAAKLLTVFVEHPVIFLGYSITDPHILDILKSITDCLTDQQLNKLSGRLIFVNYDIHGAGDEVFRSVVQGLPLTVVRTKDFAPVYEALAAQRRKFPASTLRMMKEHIYELVRTNSPKARRYVRSFEKAEAAGDAAEMYLGIGRDDSGASGIGYKSITKYDIIKDVILNENEFDAERLLVDTMPPLLQGKSTWVPIYKYLAKSGRIGDGGIVTEGLDARVGKRASMVEQEMYHPPGLTRKTAADVLACKSIGHLLERVGAKAIKLIPVLPKDRVDIRELREYMVECFGSFPVNEKIDWRTSFYRLVCFYDWLLFAPKKKV